MNELDFLKVKPGEAVLIGEDEIAKVLTFIGGSRDPDAPTLFQVANVDTGEIKFVHGEEVREIVSTYDDEIKQWSKSILFCDAFQASHWTFNGNGHYRTQINEIITDNVVMEVDEDGIAGFFDADANWDVIEEVLDLDNDGIVDAQERFMDLIG